MKTSTKAIAAMLLGGIATIASAHEMFLKPVVFYMPANARLTVDLFNGTFGKSENPITRDRMADVSVMVGGKRTHPAPAQWRDDKVSSHLALKLGGPGTYAIGLSSRPKLLTLPAKEFDAYLKHDGVEDVLAQRQRDKPAPVPVTERYSKHVRAVVQVGKALTDDASRPLGYPSELLLLQNPASLKAGSTLTFRALLHGKPLANQIVYGSYEGFHGHDARGGHINKVKLRTKADGTASFRIDRAGKWYLTMISMRRVNEPKITYESNWSTVTFQVR